MESGCFMVVRRSFYELFTSVFTSESSTSGASLYMPNKRPICSNPSTKQIRYTRKNPRKKPVERTLYPEWYRHNKGDQTPLAASKRSISNKTNTARPPPMHPPLCLSYSFMTGGSLTLHSPRTNKELSSHFVFWYFLS